MGTLTAEEIISVVDLLRSDAKGEPKGKSNDAKKSKVLTAVQKERARRRAEYDAQFEAKRVALAEAGLPEICGYPAKSEEASLHWLSALRGGAISTIAIDGLHQGTTVVRLHVEKGEQPLYLIAGAQTPVIWQFTGAVDRIERVITRKGNAVSGLDGKQVHFAPSGVCVPGPSDLGQAVAQRTFRSTLEVAFDRQRFDGKTSEWMGSRTFPVMNGSSARTSLIQWTNRSAAMARSMKWWMAHCASWRITRPRGGRFSTSSIVTTPMAW